MNTLIEEILDEVNITLQDDLLTEEIPWWHLPTVRGRWYPIERGDFLLGIAEREWIRQGKIPSREQIYQLAQVINSHENNEYLRKAGKPTKLFPQGQVTFNPVFGRDRRTKARKGEKRNFGVLFIPQLNLNPR
jgi:hypothetical protein